MEKNAVRETLAKIVTTMAQKTCIGNVRSYAPASIDLASCTTPYLTTDFTKASVEQKTRTFFYDLRQLIQIVSETCSHWSMPA